MAEVTKKNPTSLSQLQLDPENIFFSLDKTKQTLVDDLVLHGSHKLLDLGIFSTTLYSSLRFLDVGILKALGQSIDPLIILAPDWELERGP